MEILSKVSREPVYRSETCLDSFPTGGRAHKRKMIERKQGMQGKSLDLQ